MNNKDQVVFVGDLVCDLSKELFYKDYKCGPGVVLRDQQVVASIVGRPVFNQTNQTISVCNPNNYTMAVDSLVIGKVLRIKEDQALLQILQVGQHKVQGGLEGILRKNNMMQQDSDTVKVDECYLPGDVVRARVISLGGDKRVLLSTQESHCGVLFSRDSQNGKMMVGFSWDTMVEPDSMRKEKRKVSKPDFTVFVS